MAITVPKIEHKYITFFDTEEGYTSAYPSFEEVNWSEVAYPEETPDRYRLSRRLSNMYHKKDSEGYKFDNVNDSVIEEGKEIFPDAHLITNYRLQDYDDGCIRKAFFLEAVWGLFGWEWHDYEITLGTDSSTGEIQTENLTGGNLYTIKDTDTVAHIIDGDRLQHINDFLYSQYDISYVNGFNTSNLKAANRAFKRGTAKDSSYPKRKSSEIKQLILTDAHDEDWNLIDHYFGYGDTLSNLIEADSLFFNNKVYVASEGQRNAFPINIPNITHIDQLYSYGVYTDGLQFNMPKLEKLTKAFRLAILPQSTINVNQIFIGDTLNNVYDLSYMFCGASITGYETTDEGNVTSVSLDLSSSNVSDDTVIDLTRFLGWAGMKEYNTANDIKPGTILDIDLKFSKKVKLDAAFADIMRNKNTKVTMLDSTYPRNGGFEKIRINLNEDEEYISSMIGAFYSNTFIEENPIQQVPNNDCDDTYIYRYCTFNQPTTYDFLNGEIDSPRPQGYGQFDNCKFNNTFTFQNIPGLDRVEFCNISFGADVAEEDRAFPYIVQNVGDTTYRYFDIRDSKFTSIPSQDIYINTERFVEESTKYGGSDRRINPFYGCSALTDLSGINLYYSDIDDRVAQIVVWNQNFTLDFTGCKNLTKSPHIHLKYFRNKYLYFNVDFSKLKNLTEVNLENLSVRGGSPNVGAGQNFRDCTNLVYLRLATNTEDGFSASLDIRGCKSLDIPTLEETLLKVKHGTIKMLLSTWESLSTSTQEYCTSKATIEVTEDSSYTPA